MTDKTTFANIDNGIGRVIEVATRTDAYLSVTDTTNKYRIDAVLTAEQLDDLIVALQKARTEIEPDRG